MECSRSEGGRHDGGTYRHFFTFSASPLFASEFRRAASHFHPSLSSGPGRVSLFASNSAFLVSNNAATGYTSMPFFDDAFRRLGQIRALEMRPSPFTMRQPSRVARLTALRLPLRTVARRPANFAGRTRIVFVQTVGVYDIEPFDRVVASVPLRLTIEPSRISVYASFISPVKLRVVELSIATAYSRMMATRFISSPPPPPLPLPPPPPHEIRP
ncbi:hypothetical protein V9T40_007906 [Parthenolecanium corni]|uniref:Uncharacterized protein n=1 Tax=Parthenolecanium corni TaxID=536013 RepID=A0AAN9TP42_9HEMI